MTLAECYKTTKDNLRERKEDGQVGNHNANGDYPRNETLSGRPQIPRACIKETRSPTGHQQGSGD